MRLLAAIFNRAGAALLALPRLARIVIAFVVAALVVAVVFPIVDLVYLRYFFTPQTVVVPALVTMLIGAGAYILGWRLLVQADDDAPVWFALLYVVLGVFALVLFVALVVAGVVILNAE